MPNSRGGASCLLQQFAEYRKQQTKVQAGACLEPSAGHGGNPPAARCKRLVESPSLVSNSVRQSSPSPLAASTGCSIVSHLDECSAACPHGRAALSARPPTPEDRSLVCAHLITGRVIKWWPRFHPGGTARVSGTGGHLRINPRITCSQLRITSSHRASQQPVPPVVACAEPLLSCPYRRFPKGTPMALAKSSSSFRKRLVKTPGSGITSREAVRASRRAPLYDRKLNWAPGQQDQVRTRTSNGESAEGEGGRGEGGQRSMSVSLRSGSMRGMAPMTRKRMELAEDLGESR